MTFKIYYNNYKMFDVELYVGEIDGLYYTDVKPHLLAEGMAHYLIDKVKTPEDLDEFLKGVNEIEDLKDLLFESNWVVPNWTNDFLNCHAADVRLCKIHMPKFEKIMRDFCEKFNLELSVD